MKFLHSGTVVRELIHSRTSRTGSRTEATSLYSSRTYNLSHVTSGHAQWEFPVKQRRNSNITDISI